MRKTLVILLALMLSASMVYAAAPSSGNVSILSGTGGPSGLTPVTEIVRVRYAHEGDSATRIVGSLSSGDVVVWSTTSADGLTISGCIAKNEKTYAGVLVTDILTPGGTKTQKVTSFSRNWGYMAVRGYCLAKVDTSAATTGSLLVANGTALTKSFAADTTGISIDIGVLLTDTAVDGLMPVWLRG